MFYKCLCLDKYCKALTCVRNIFDSDSDICINNIFLSHFVSELTSLDAFV